MIDTWALSLWVGGARSCDGHVTHVAMVIYLPSVPSNELNGGILKHEKVKTEQVLWYPNIALYFMYKAYVHL